MREIADRFAKAQGYRLRFIDHEVPCKRRSVWVKEVAGQEVVMFEKGCLVTARFLIKHNLKF